MLTYIREYRELKRRLECQVHRGRHCYISPVNGEHKEVSRKLQTLWAKEIVCCLVFFLSKLSDML